MLCCETCIAKGPFGSWLKKQYVKIDLRNEFTKDGQSLVSGCFKMWFSSSRNQLFLGSLSVKSCAGNATKCVSCLRVFSRM